MDPDRLPAGGTADAEGYEQSTRLHEKCLAC